MLSPYMDAINSKNREVLLCLVLTRVILLTLTNYNINLDHPLKDSIAVEP